MTAPGAEGPQSLLGRLMAVVRAEFRSQTLIFEPDDPVFGGGACRVAGCDRHARGHGLCLNHRVRWVKQDARTWRNSSRGPTRGYNGNDRTSGARSPAADTDPRAKACVSCMLSGGNGPGGPTAGPGWLILR